MLTASSRPSTFSVARKYTRRRTNVTEEVHERVRVDDAKKEP